jgi:hypothetical protein
MRSTARHQNSPFATRHKTYQRHVSLIREGLAVPQVGVTHPDIPACLPASSRAWPSRTRVERAVSWPFLAALALLLTGCANDSPDSLDSLIATEGLARAAFEASPTLVM